MRDDGRSRVLKSLMCGGEKCLLIKVETLFFNKKYIKKKKNENLVKVIYSHIDICKCIYAHINGNIYFLMHANINVSYG